MAYGDTWRRILLALCALALLCPVGAHAVCDNTDPDWLSHFEGTLGAGLRVRMSLVFDGEQVRGVYVYASQLKDIALEGHMEDGTRLVLDELDSRGQPVARFDARFLDHDPSGRFQDGQLGCTILDGSWRKLTDPSKTLPVRLWMEDSAYGSLDARYAAAGAPDQEQVHRNALRFYNAVKQGDRKTVAGLLVYPLRVKLPEGTKRLRGPAELLAHYDAIFSDSYKAAIAAAVPRNMFARDQGIMLGRGEVWFGADGRVIALNNF